MICKERNGYIRKINSKPVTLELFKYVKLTKNICPFLLVYLAKKKLKKVKKTKRPFTCHPIRQLHLSYHILRLLRHCFVSTQTFSDFCCYVETPYTTHEEAVKTQNSHHLNKNIHLFDHNLVLAEPSALLYFAGCEIGLARSTSCSPSALQKLYPSLRCSRQKQDCPSGDLDAGLCIR